MHQHYCPGGRGGDRVCIFTLFPYIIILHNIILFPMYITLFIINMYVYTIPNNNVNIATYYIHIIFTYFPYIHNTPPRWAGLPPCGRGLRWRCRARCGASPGRCSPGARTGGACPAAADPTRYCIFIYLIPKRYYKVFYLILLHILNSYICL